MTDQRTANASALLERADLAILSTLDEQASPDARAIFNLRKVRPAIFHDGAAALSPAFDSWIATNTSSLKVRELRRDPRGSLYYLDAGTFEGLTLQGSFEEIHDHSIRAAIWVDSWAMYYPGGLDGGDFSVFRFTARKARYYHGLSVLEFDPSRIPALAR